RETEPPSRLPYLRLQKSSHGKESARELILREREEKVGLVLLPVRAAREDPSTVRPLLDTRIVPRRHIPGAKPSGSIEQGRKLQAAVAVRAGERRPAGGVLGDEIRDDGLLELPLEVDDVMGKADRRGDPPSVMQVVERAARSPRLSVALIVELHRQTN